MRMAGMGRERTLTPISTPNDTITTMDHATTSMSPSAETLSPLQRTYQQSNLSPATSHSHPQWSHQETVELISIRGELERDFSASKRNKFLWENVASRMRERGFVRSPHQCKCKWKNLLIRYKGKETSDPIKGKQCPYFEELHAIFSERTKNSQQNLMESHQFAVQSRKRMKTDSGDQFSDYLSQGEGAEGVDSDDARNRKTNAEKNMQSTREISAVLAKISSSNGIEEMLRVFFQQQQRLEMQWREAMERRQLERESFEQEWRHSMEKLERERLTMEKEWREREEQWKMREETRAEKMDVLLTTMLKKLISEDHS